MSVLESVASEPWNVARVIASCDLSPDAKPITRPASSEWAHLLSLMSEQRLCGVALRAVESGILDLSERQYDELIFQHEMQLALDLRIERLVLACFDRLSQSGIDARLLKGPAISHRFYDDPALRSFGDADILVPRADFRVALDVIATIGFSRKTQLPRTWFDRYVKAACLIATDGLEVDVHQMVTPGPYGVTIEPDDLFREPPDHVMIGRHSIACLRPEMAFVHACVHAALGDPSPRLVSLRDVVAIQRGGLDEEAVRERVRTWQLEAVVARALRLAESILDVRAEGLIADHYRSYRPSRRDKWRLSCYDARGSRFPRQSAATLWELASLKDKAAYALALALPDRSYLRARGSTYSQRVRYSVTLTRASRPK